MYNRQDKCLFLKGDIMQPRKSFIESIRDGSFLTEEHLNECLAEVDESSGRTLEKVIIEKRYLSELEVCRVKSRMYYLPYCDITLIKCNPQTVNLLKDKIEAEGKKREEAIMLLNHKAALKAIVEHSAYFRDLSLARMEDVHSVLIEELGVERNLRHIRVGISGTRYRPLEVESQIREAVEDMCALVNGKSDPYEKALLTLLLIAYIQPFTDGNKRTSRLMANSLLISRSLCPLSFRTVEANDYRAALLLFYEQNNLSAFKKMFLEQVEFAMKEYF